jgi:pilin isopeptide linkage protein
MGTVLLLMLGGFSSSAEGEKSVTVSIPVEVQIDGDKPATAIPVNIILEPEAAGYPMPVGGPTQIIEPDEDDPNLTEAVVTIHTPGTETFTDLVYTKTGIYYYTIRQQESDVEGYTCDPSVYQLEVCVIEEHGNLIANLYAFKGKEKAKQIEILFINEYEEPEEETSESTEPSEEESTEPSEEESTTEPSQEESTEPETSTTVTETSPSASESSSTEPETSPSESETSTTKPETTPAEAETSPVEAETMPATTASSSNSPFTGDDTNQSIWDILMLLSGTILSLGVIFELQRRKTK